MNFVEFLYLQPDYIKKQLRNNENLEMKLISARVATFFNKTCLNENLLPSFTNIYIIYIWNNEMKICEHDNITHPSTLCTRQHYAPVNITHTSTLCTRQHYAPVNITHTSTLRTRQQYAHVNIMRPSTLCTRQHYAPVNITHTSTLCTRQHYALVNIMHPSTLCTRQHYALVNITHSSTLYTRQHYAPVNIPEIVDLICGSNRHNTTQEKSFSIINSINNFSTNC